MNEAEWRKVLAAIQSEDPQEREDTYQLVNEKFWNDEVLEKLEAGFDAEDLPFPEKVAYTDAIAAVGLEKAIPFLTKKRAEIHRSIKAQSDVPFQSEEPEQLLACIDAALKRIITSFKTKGELSLKNLVQKNFALK